MTRNHNHKKIVMSVGMYAGMLIYYLLFFRLIRDSALSADDMWNSNLWAARYTGEISAWWMTKTQFVMWLHLGRFFPVSNLAAYVYEVFQTITAYKTAIIVAVYLDNLVCSLCVREITKNRVIGYFYMLLFPVLIQLTPEYDSGLYCYHLLIQTVVLFGLLSVYGLVRYIDTGKLRYNVLSAVSLLLALCTYEVGFVFILVLVYVAYQRTRSVKQTLRYGIADGAVFLLICLWNVVIRLVWKTGSYDGIQVRLSPVRILVTLLKQCSTCIPLGRYICTYIRGEASKPFYYAYSYSIRELLHEIHFLDILVIALFIGIYVLLLRRLSKHREDSYKQIILDMIVIGLILWIVPGFLIALSSKYQEHLGWCSGHLPAYMQSLGFTLIILGIVLAIWKRFRRERSRRVFGWICGIMAVVIMLLNQVTARETLEYMNGYRKYPQENITYAAETGIFDELDGQSDRIIIGTTAYIYDVNSCRQFYSKFIQKNIYAMTRGDLQALVLGEDSAASQTTEDVNGVMVDAYDLTLLDQTYYGINNMADKTSGALIFGQLTEMDLNSETGELLHMWIENPTIYIRGNGELMTGVDTGTWQIQEEQEDYKIYTMSGRCDILQEPAYYEEEYNHGVLYRQ